LQACGIDEIDDIDLADDLRRIVQALDDPDFAGRRNINTCGIRRNRDLGLQQVPVFIDQTALRVPFKSSVPGIADLSVRCEDLEKARAFDLNIEWILSDDGRT